MPRRPARRTLGLAVAGLFGLLTPACSNGGPQVDDAVATPDPSVKPPPEPSPVQPSTSPATAGAASAPSPAPTPAPASDAPKP